MIKLFFIVLLISWLNICVFATTENKGGKCPTVSGVGICVELCSSDANCTGLQKCCSNGCGHVCTDPVPDPCTDEDILANAAIDCAAPRIIDLITQPTLKLQCDIVMDTILPCIIDSVNATCTPKQQHDITFTFRDDIKTFLQGFDVVDCLPVRSCAEIASILYYLPIYCNTDYESFASTGNCSKLRGALGCLRDAFNTTSDDSCTEKVVYNTTVYNMQDWPYDICPACDPLAGYFCGLGPIRRDCPSDYYCNIHPADGFAVCCPEDQDTSTTTTSTTTSTTTAQATTYKDTSIATSIRSSIPTLLTIFTMIQFVLYNL